MRYTYEDRNSVAYYLAPRIKSIWGMKMNACTLEDMKKNIKSYIWNATYQYRDANGHLKYTEKKDFLDVLEACETKSSIYNWCKAWIDGGKSTYSSYNR